MRLSPPPPLEKTRQDVTSCCSPRGDGSRPDGHFGPGLPPGAAGPGARHRSPPLPPARARRASTAAPGSSLAGLGLPGCCCTVPRHAVPCRSGTRQGPPWQCQPEKAQSHPAVLGRLVRRHRLTPGQRWRLPGEACRLLVWEFFVALLDVCACLWETPHAEVLGIWCLVGGRNSNIGQCSKITK